MTRVKVFMASWPAACKNTNNLFRSFVRRFAIPVYVNLASVEQQCSHAKLGRKDCKMAVQAEPRVAEVERIAVL